MIQEQNLCTKYLVELWAKQSVGIQHRNYVLNKDLLRNCNVFLKNHFEAYDIEIHNKVSFVSIKILRLYLKQYFQTQDLLHNIKLQYHHTDGRGIQGIYLLNLYQQEELILKNIRSKIFNDFQIFYKKNRIPAFNFNQPYQSDYYQSLKQKVSSLPTYFSQLFHIYNTKWKETYELELRKLKKASKLEWYKKNHRFDKLFPSLYGINKIYPRYKIFPTYGTIISLPQELRQKILKNLNTTSLGKFYTLDFVACHLNITVGLFKKDAPSCYRLLKEDLFWQTIIEQIYNNYRDNQGNSIQSHLSHQELKIILKKLVYKKLQGGNLLYTNDIYQNLDKNLKTKVSRDFKYLINYMKSNVCIQEIEKITTKVNSEKIIYTPEQLEGYALRVKRQRISRLTTGIEVCLLLHLILIIIKMTENFIPISLEHDGLLIYGVCNDIQDYIRRLNLEFQRCCNHLIQHTITIELKS